MGLLSSYNKLIYNNKLIIINILSQNPRELDGQLQVSSPTTYPWGFAKAVQ